VYSRVSTQSTSPVIDSLQPYSCKGIRFSVKHLENPPSQKEVKPYIQDWWSKILYRVRPDDTFSIATYDGYDWYSIYYWHPVSEQNENSRRQHENSRWQHHEQPKRQELEAGLGLLEVGQHVEIDYLYGSSDVCRGDLYCHDITALHVSGVRIRFVKDEWSRNFLS